MQLNISDFPVLKSAQGDPIWPEEISGSISHSQDLAVAIVSKTHRFVGVDLEYKNKDRNPKIFERICSEREQFWAQQDPKYRGMQIFSAKEAIYKAFFSIAKLGFKDVELSWENNYFNCRLTRDLEQSYQNNFEFKCQQSEYKDYILSIVAL